MLYKLQRNKFIHACHYINGNLEISYETVFNGDEEGNFHQIVRIPSFLHWQCAKIAVFDDAQICSRMLPPRHGVTQVGQHITLNWALTSGTPWGAVCWNRMRTTKIEVDFM